MLDTAPQRSGTANLRIIIAVCAEALKKCRSLEGVGPGTRAQINAAYEMAASEIHKGRRSLPDHRRLFDEACVGVEFLGEFSEQH